MLPAIKTLLGLETSEQDAVLQIMIEDARSAVRDYCNRKECPEALDYVVRQLVINSFTENNEGQIASVRRGDTQISYAQPITKGSFTELQRNAMNRYKMIRMD